MAAAQVIAQIKGGGVQALHAPLNTLVADWAYTVRAALAWSTRAWMALAIPVTPRWRAKHPRRDVGDGLGARDSAALRAGLPEAAPHGPPIMPAQRAARVRQALQVADERAFGRWLWVSMELAQWMVEHWDAVQAGSVEVDVEVGQ